jgi:cardiolipin synthase A/B
MSRTCNCRLVNQGIEIWEYQPQVLHAKLIVMDDLAFVCSSNLDPRSLRINFEIMLRIQDATLAATARQQSEADLAQRAIPITREALRHDRTWGQRLKQRFAYWLFAARLGVSGAQVAGLAWPQGATLPPFSCRPCPAPQGSESVGGLEFLAFSLGPKHL